LYKILSFFTCKIIAKKIFVVYFVKMYFMSAYKAILSILCSKGLAEERGEDVKAISDERGRPDGDDEFPEAGADRGANRFGGRLGVQHPGRGDLHRHFRRHHGGIGRRPGGEEKARKPMISIVQKAWSMWSELFQGLPYGDPYVAMAVLFVLFVLAARMVAGGEEQHG
jgi:hypothetical protein